MSSVELNRNMLFLQGGAKLTISCQVSHTSAVLYYRLLLCVHFLT
jgi:hypothetical protein